MIGNIRQFQSFRFGNVAVCHIIFYSFAEIAVAKQHVDT